jgi:acetoin utilization protein AcuB
MLVGRRMHSPVITVTPDMPIVEALNFIRKEKIRRAPVIKNGKLVGIISETDLLNASPSSATSLSIWEVNYLISRILVEEVMTKNVITVEEDTPIEEAARVMADNKFGALPVVRDDQIVGIITETDIFKTLLELMGARESGVRVTALVQEERGKLAQLAEVISNAQGNFVAFGTFAGDDPSNRLVTFKVTGISIENMKKLISPIVERIIDIRLSKA